MAKSTIKKSLASDLDTFESKIAMTNTYTVNLGANYNTIVIGPSTSGGPLVRGAALVFGVGYNSTDALSCVFLVTWHLGNGNSTVKVLSGGTTPTVALDTTNKTVSIKIGTVYCVTVLTAVYDPIAISKAST